MDDLKIVKDKQYYKFCMYGFFKNLKFFEPFFILFFIDAGLKYSLIGILYAVREIAINIMEIPSGFIADVLGRRRTMIVSFVGYIIAFLVFYLSNTFWLFLIAMLFYSIGDAFRTGTHKAMIYDYLHQNNWSNKKVEYYGHTRSWSQFGSALSSLLALIIVFYSGNYRLVFLVALFPYLLNVLLLLSYPKSLDGEIKQMEQTKIKAKFATLFAELKISFAKKQVWTTIGNLSLYQGFFKASKDYLQTIIVAFVITTTWFQFKNEESRVAIFIGVFYFIIFIIASVISRKASKISSVFKSNEQTINATLILGGVIGLTIGCLMHFDSPFLAILLFLFLYIIQNIRKPVGTAILATQLSKNSLASGLSVHSQFDSLISAILALTIGFFADWFSLAYAFAFIGFLIIVLASFVQLKSINSKV